jgi:hypothetical protein
MLTLVGQSEWFGDDIGGNRTGWGVGFPLLNRNRSTGLAQFFSGLIVDISISTLATGESVIGGGDDDIGRTLV